MSWFVTFATIDEAFRRARRRLPATLYNRIDGGTPTCRENSRIFDDVYFRPRAAAVFEDRDLHASVLGSEISFPVLLASAGGGRLIHPKGELATAAAAGRAGTINVVAMGTGHPLEEVASVASAPVWQQLSMSRGREGAEELIERAADAGFQALVVTVDMPVSPFPVVPGVKVISPGLNLQYALKFGPEAIRRPRWLAAFIRDELGDRDVSEAERLPVIPGATQARLRTGALTNKLSATWDDFEWIRRLWTGPIVVKGVLCGDDSRRAVDVGASAVIVSNHGGTMLHVPPTLRMLPQIVAAINGECEVLLDGGIRNGAQVVKAIALGARAVLIGRSYLMGLAVAGESGVYQVLEILRNEIDQTLGALGCPSVAALDPSYVEMPKAWPRWSS
jgi:isopentenyl diphosphate isomerase/L-lactate dehydrogenase-like FMN-dependent dehydrogenase